MRLLFAAALLFISPFELSCQQTSTIRTPATPSLETVLSLLPADTESIMVAANSKSAKRLPRSTVSMQLLTLHAFPESPEMANVVIDKQVELLLHGSRRFRPPAQLGSMLYEGCTIAILPPKSKSGARIKRQMEKGILREEKILGVTVHVLQKRLEQDTWTYFVAFPNSTSILSCTDRGYLEEVLARMQGKVGNNAFPESLPEWRYVDLASPFWAMCHFQTPQAKTGSRTFLSHSDYWRDKIDPNAIGLTISIEESGRHAKVSYLTSDSRPAGDAVRKFMTVDGSKEAEPMRVQIKQLAPGAFEGTFFIGNADALNYFKFVALSWLGHSIFL